MIVFEVKKRAKLEHLLWIVTGLFFFIKLLEAFCFINYYDPFAYHLAFPKAWLETSFHQAMLDNDLFLIAGVFDYLYIIPMFLTNSDPYNAQIMGQVMHFIFSLGAGSLLLANYFKSKVFAPLAALCLLSISKSATFFMVAKNDGALSLAILFTFILIFDDNYLKKLKGKWRALAIGVLLGLIPAIKLNGLLYATVIGIYCLLKNRKNIKHVLIIIISSFSLVSLILFKNWFYIKNPLFPGLASKIPSEATKEMIAFYSYYMDSEVVASLFVPQLKHFFLGKMIYLLSLFSITYLLFNFKKYFEKEFLKSSLLIFVIAAICYVFYVLVNGGLPTYRFIFPVYFLLTFFLFKEWDKYEAVLSKIKYFPMIIIVFILADSKIDKSISRLIKYLKNRELSSKEVVRADFAYSAFWDYIKPDEKDKKTYIISDYLSNMYYSPKGVRVQCSLLDRNAGFIHDCKDGDVSLLEKYSYAFLKEQIGNPCYEKIRTQGLPLHKIQNIVLYDIRALDFNHQGHNQL